MNNLKKDICFYAVVFAVFYVLCSFNFMNGDDFAYCFKYYYTKSAQHDPITSLADVLDSQAYDYMTWGGRFIVHSIVQIFCGILGMELFRIINSVVFVALCVGCVTLLRRLQGRKAADYILVVFAMFVLVPEVGRIFMGPIAMCVNYLWPACAVVWLLVIYDKVRQKERVSLAAGIGLFLVACIVGCLQESFTISLSGAMFFYYAFHLRKFRGPVVWLVLGLWLGTAIVTLAPGNFARLTESEVSYGGTFLGRMINRVWSCFGVLRMVLLLAVLLIGIGLFDRRSLKTFVEHHLIFLLVILLNLAPVLAAYTGSRQVACAEFFSIILVLRLLYIYCGKFIEYHQKVVNASLCTFLLLLCIPVYGIRRADYRAYENLFNSEVNNGVLIAGEYHKRVLDYYSDPFCRQYSCMYLFRRWNMEYLSTLKTGGKDKTLIQTILPETPETLDKKYRLAAKNGAYHNQDGCYWIVKAKNGVFPKCLIEVRSDSYIRRLISKITGKDSNHLFDISCDVNPFVVGDTTYGIFYEMDEVRKFDVVDCRLEEPDKKVHLY